MDRGGTSCFMLKLCLAQLGGPAHGVGGPQVKWVDFSENWVLRCDIETEKRAWKMAINNG